MSINPTVYEQLMLEMINWARANPTAQANALGIDLNASLAPGTISGTAKQPLAFNATLIDAARVHSQWMLDADVFSHTGQGGSSPGDRMGAAGYDFSGGWGYGENIAWGGSTGAIDMQQQTIGRHEGLFVSSGHRVNLMNDDFVEVGVGILQGAFTSGGAAYNAAMVTQNFAYSGNKTFLTGVILDDQDGDRFYDIGEGVGAVTIEATGQSGTYSTTSWAAGGYNLEVPAGNYAVTFTYAGKQVTSNVTVGQDNVKLDATLGEMGAGTGGGAVDDTYNTGAGNLSFDGGAGNDTVVYAGARSDFSASIEASGAVLIQKPDGIDTLVSIERAEFSDGVLLFDVEGANGPAAYRLYGGAFDRTPDEGGFLFWADYLNDGGTLLDAAAGFIASAEFSSLYGSGLTDAEFVDQLYLNVLGRPGEEAGVDFWNDYLADGGARSAALVNFTQLAEYVGLSAPDIEDGYWVA
ncbi:DUF4214 domain-containing protein [Mesorhizobium sp. CAU 1741]|uniref:DUF4214 domain-containing protein n=1 Tax=Mesorhizobium sp. CAU 1741 TaxID=3140366 RepID=UPI00325B9364